MFKKKTKKLGAIKKQMKLDDTRSAANLVENKPNMQFDPSPSQANDGDDDDADSSNLESGAFKKFKSKSLFPDALSFLADSFLNRCSYYDNHQRRLDDSKYGRSSSDLVAFSGRPESSGNENEENAKSRRNSVTEEDENINTTTTSESLSLAFLSSSSSEPHETVRSDSNETSSLLLPPRPYFKNEKSIQITTPSGTCDDEDDGIVSRKVTASITATLNNNNNSEIKHERDEFDDLIDLSHRVPKKLLKVAASQCELESKSTNNNNKSKNGNLFASSSLPPLPPLPYSFVKLEHRNKCPIKSSSTLSLSRLNQQADDAKSELQVKQAATTRLIIPVDRTKAAAQSGNDGAPFCITTTTSLKPETTTTTSPTKLSFGSLPRDRSTKSCFLGGRNFRYELESSNGGEINVEIFHPNNSNRNETKSVTASAATETYVYFGKLKNQLNQSTTRRSNEQEKLSSESMEQSTSSEKKKDHQSSSSFSSSFSSTSSESLKEEAVTLNDASEKIVSPNESHHDLVATTTHPKSNSSSSNCFRLKDESPEWEQITKIFASLESLLNEVIENTSNNLRTSLAKTENACLGLSGQKKSKNSACKYQAELNSAASNDDVDDVDELCSDSSDSNLLTSAVFSNKLVVGRGVKNGKVMMMSDGFNHIDHLLNKKKLKYIEISEFLKRIGMSKYERTFLLNGYDDLNFIVVF